MTEEDSETIATLALNLSVAGLTRLKWTEKDKPPAVLTTGQLMRMASNQTVEAVLSKSRFTFMTPLEPLFVSVRKATSRSGATKRKTRTGSR